MIVNQSAEAQPRRPSSRYGPSHGPDDSIAQPFDSTVAEIAARLYRSLRRPRGREIDLAIAAHALALDAELWTLNREDFADIPSLQLV